MQKKGGTRLTNNLGSVIPRVFELDAMSVESVQVHSVTVVELICPMS